MKMCELFLMVNTLLSLYLLVMLSIISLFTNLISYIPELKPVTLN